ncbi:MAG: hypothetical protein MJZ68_02845 [archaeon]|nr:hypothetical protein [archaeon]
MEHPILNYSIPPTEFDEFVKGLKVLSAGSDDPKAKIPAVRLDLPDFDNREYSVVLHTSGVEPEKNIRSDREFWQGDELRRFKDGVEQRRFHGTWEDIRHLSGVEAGFGGQAYKYFGHTATYYGEVYSMPETTKNEVRIFVVDRASHPGIVEIVVKREVPVKSSKKI